MKTNQREKITQGVVFSIQKGRGTGGVYRLERFFWLPIQTHFNVSFTPQLSKLIQCTSIEKCLGFVPHYDLIATKLGDALV